MRKYVLPPTTPVPTSACAPEGLVNKERQLAGLQLEEKEREAELWRKKYLQLQASSVADHLVPNMYPVARFIVLALHHSRNIAVGVAVLQDFSRFRNSNAGLVTF